MVSPEGNPVSDIKTIVADNPDPRENSRVMKIGLTLRGEKYDKTRDYRLLVVDKDTGDIADSFDFKIDVAFTDDFDF